MNNQQQHDYYQNNSAYNPEVPHQLFSNEYEEILMGDVEEEQEFANSPSLLDRVSKLFLRLKNRFQQRQWGKITILCTLLLVFSMLYSGDNKEKVDSSLLLPAGAEEQKEVSEMTDQELEELRFQEQLAEKAVKKQQEDNEIVRNLQLLKEMKEREEALKEREAEVQAKEGQMKTIEEGVMNRIAEMEKLKNELQELVTLRKDLGEKSIRQLVKVYENMKPNEASTIIERLDEDISVQILLRMKGKKAGKILNVMKPAISVRLSEEIARRK